MTPDIAYKFIQTVIWPSPVEYILQQKYLKSQVKQQELFKVGNEASKDISKKFFNSFKSNILTLRLVLSNGVINGNNREYTVSPETQKKMLNFGNINSELKFYNTRSGIDNTRNDKSYGRDYMVENIMMQRMEEE